MSPLSADSASSPAARYRGQSNTSTASAEGDARNLSGPSSLQGAVVIPPRPASAAAHRSLGVPARSSAYSPSPSSASANTVPSTPQGGLALSLAALQFARAASISNASTASGGPSVAGSLGMGGYASPRMSLAEEGPNGDPNASPLTTLSPRRVNPARHSGGATLLRFLPTHIRPSGGSVDASPHHQFHPSGAGGVSSPGGSPSTQSAASSARNSVSSHQNSFHHHPHHLQMLHHYNHNYNMRSGATSPVPGDGSFFGSSGSFSSVSNGNGGNGPFASTHGFVLPQSYLGLLWRVEVLRARDVDPSSSSLFSSSSAGGAGGSNSACASAGSTPSTTATTMLAASLTLGGGGGGKSFTLYDILLRGVSRSSSVGPAGTMAAGAPSSPNAGGAPSPLASALSDPSSPSCAASSVFLLVDRCVSKRYSEFRSFDTALRRSRKERHLSNRALAPLPPSTHLFQQMSARRKEERRAAFEVYLNTLLQDCGAAAPVALVALAQQQQDAGFGMGGSGEVAPASPPPLSSSVSVPSLSSSLSTSVPHGGFPGAAAVAAPSAGGGAPTDTASLALLLHFLLDGSHAPMPMSAPALSPRTLSLAAPPSTPGTMSPAAQNNQQPQQYPMQQQVPVHSHWVQQPE